MAIPSKSPNDQDLAPEAIQVFREICQRRFFHFVEEFWETIITEDPVWNWHIEYICDEIQGSIERLIQGEPCQEDILINIPPGTSKSTILTIMLPVWLWIRDPSKRCMTVSYAQTLSHNHSEKSRDIMRSEKFQILFPEIQVRKDIDSKSRYQNYQGGERRASSVTGSVTGFHADLLIVDDPLNPNEASSEKDRDRANRFMNETLPTRKINKETAVTILIMQRLHENDPSGSWISNPNKRIKHICLPGYESPRINPPELRERYIDGQMDPIRLPHSAMETLKINLGSYAYAGQIGQEPAPADGEMWQRSWFIVKPREKILQEYKIQEIGYDWDLAYTKDERNSASAFTQAGRVIGDPQIKVVILDIGFRWLEFPDLIKWMMDLGRPHYIEGKASGKSAKQFLVKNGIPAIEVQVPMGSDKIARTKMVTPYAEAGMIVVAREIVDSFLDDPQQGILKFPNTGTDLNDSFVQALNRLIQKRRPKIKQSRMIR